jgi:hypothetical protein
MHQVLLLAEYKPRSVPSNMKEPIATGSEYSVTEVTLSDNAQDATYLRLTLFASCRSMP